jgi:hypothetical protein
LEKTVKVLIDDFGNKGSEIEVGYKDLSDDVLINFITQGDTKAQEELDRRVEAEVIADMKKSGMTAKEIKEVLIADKGVQADIVKVNRKAIDRAIDRLNALPDDEPNCIIVPWAQAPRPKLATEEWADADLKSYMIASLVATQKYVKRDSVEWHLRNLNDASADNKSLPNVVVDGDTNLIYDGHHRLVAYWLLGADFANCWTLEIHE